MIKNQQKKSITVTLPMDLYEKINHLAKEGYRTNSGYIRLILTRYIRYLEQENYKDTWLNID